MKRRDFLSGLTATAAMATLPGFVLAAAASAGVTRAASASLLRRTGLGSDPWGLATWGDPIPAGARIEGSELKLWIERPGGFTATEPITIAGVEWSVLDDARPGEVVTICRREFAPIDMRPGDTLRVS